MQQPATIDFFYDIGSPYSYLAALRADAFGESVGAEVRWRPFLLGAVFKATGNEPPARIPAKAAWMWSDLSLQADQLGVRVTLPESFPTNSLAPQRALVAIRADSGGDALRRATLALYEAYWGDGRDVGESAILRDVLAGAGFDHAVIARAIATPEVKHALRAETDEAIARGAFGAPTFFVGDTLFFGSDRFDLMRHHIGGAA